MKVYLKQSYYDPEFPGSYSGPDKFHKGILSQGRTDISLGTVKAWLKSQDIYSNHRLYPLKSAVKGPRVIVPTKGYLFNSDTANLVSYAADNKGYKYILILIDILTRHAWTKPLKSLKSQETTQALLEILPPQAEKLRTDGGSEYKGGLDSVLRKRGIDHFRTTNAQKACFAERLIRTLKSLLLKYMEQTNSHRWVHVLQTFTTSYNNSYHRSIDTTPYDAWHNLPNAELWSRQYLPPKTVVRPKAKRLPRGMRGYKYKIGNYVIYRLNLTDFITGAGLLRFFPQSRDNFTKTFPYTASKVLIIPLSVGGFIIMNYSELLCLKTAPIKSIRCLKRNAVARRLFI